MIKIELQFFGGRGAGSGLPESNPSGGGGGRPTGMDAQPGMAANTAEALGPKGRPMSVDSAVGGANPLYNMGAEYQYNCQRAAGATEARFRGYNVQALPTFDNDTMPQNNNYLDMFVGGRKAMQQINGSTSGSTKRKVEAAMKQHGNGSRALLAVTWSGGRNGHVINVVQRNGKTHYYDGQDGTKVNASSLFKAISKSAGVRLTRVDNLPFSDITNQVLKRKGK